MSDSESNKNINGKRVSYSTDYMVNYLHDSQKLVSPRDRKLYEKINKQHDDDSAIDDDDINNYTLDEEEDKETKSDSERHTRSDKSKNVFEDSFKFSGKDNNGSVMDDSGDDNDSKNNSSKKDSQALDESYDNYNELSDGAKMLKRLDMLKKLGYLSTIGINLTQNYNINSDYFTMKYEYKLHKDVKEKTNFINWTSSILLNCVWGLEIINEEYNPFKLKLTDWSKQINADINEYYEVFGEIYEQYNISGNGIRPEFKLLFMLGTSALKYHVNNNNRERQIMNERMNATMGMNANATIRDEIRRNNDLNDRIVKSESDFKDKMNKEHDQVHKHMSDMRQFQQQSENAVNSKKELDKKAFEKYDKIKQMMAGKNSNSQMPSQMPPQTPSQNQNLINQQQQQNQQLRDEMNRIQQQNQLYMQQINQMQESQRQIQMQMQMQNQMQNHPNTIYENINSRINNGSVQKQNPDNERRSNINNQLSSMSKNMQHNINNDPLDKNAYKKKAKNVKKRKSKITVDTSSEESNGSNETSEANETNDYTEDSNNSNESDTIQSSNIEESDKGTLTNNEIEQLANKKKVYTKKSKDTQSGNKSRQYSKRSYRKNNPITVDV